MKELTPSSDIRFLDTYNSRYLRYMSQYYGKFCPGEQIARDLIYRNKNKEALFLTSKDLINVKTSLYNCAKVLIDGNSNSSIYHVYGTTLFGLIDTKKENCFVELPYYREGWMDMFSEETLKKITGGWVVDNWTIKKTLTNAQYGIFSVICGLNMNKGIANAAEVAKHFYKDSGLTEQQSIRVAIKGIRSKIEEKSLDFEIENDFGVGYRVIFRGNSKQLS